MFAHPPCTYHKNRSKETWQKSPSSRSGAATLVDTRKSCPTTTPRCAGCSRRTARFRPTRWCLVCEPSGRKPGESFPTPASAAGASWTCT
ncbi:hypothetical protein VTK73DRAFT_9883 [Phialemonium thermophilum]|uniref:Uncharacterized protein n=1 Tax=Phialemonium thermophilum TaxID=223376 RepID=A0ABR3VZM5_9PEZI